MAARGLLAAAARYRSRRRSAWPSPCIAQQGVRFFSSNNSYPGQQLLREFHIGANQLSRVPEVHAFLCEKGTTGNHDGINFATGHHTCGGSLCCSHHSNGRMGTTGRVIRPVHEVIPLNTAASMTIANKYSSSSRFEEKAKIRALMESRGLKKEPGWSRIELQGQLFTFLVDDHSHPRDKEIRKELQRLLVLMKDAGYTADIRCVLRDIPDSEKENALMHHSERLAMALGHLSLPPKAPMRVIKNLRVCNDCHTATKYFAKIYERDIIVRDATRFHHFKAEGYCTCGDYW